MKRLNLLFKKYFGIVGNHWYYIPLMFLMMYLSIFLVFYWLITEPFVEIINKIKEYKKYHQYFVAYVSVEPYIESKKD